MSAVWDGENSSIAEQTGNTRRKYAALPNLSYIAQHHNIVALRALLDETTFQGAWAEGSKMTLEQAVAEALGE